VDPALLSAAGDNRRNPAVALDLMRAPVSVAPAAKCRDEPRCQRRARTGERFHERVIRVLTRQVVNLFVVHDNGDEELLEQTCPSHNSSAA